MATILAVLLALLIGLSLAKQLKAVHKEATATNNYDSLYSDWVKSTAYKNEEIANELYFQSSLWGRAKLLEGTYGGQCVSFARRFTGFGRDEIASMARNTKVNSDVPELGAIVVTNESTAGHVAVVISVSEDTITVVESNYIPLRVGIREIPRKSNLIIGYYAR